ncbi:hypothetical protein GIB67_009391 [Kingdonia uniflora]|uniref:Helitron helicase-like domain-containing protein n=1 Tax=Kingdonia uniflora TaxID=39325 RepID=A0A7J7N3A1_9MAGN|nr:hypothetical protein GIB67_009391 [Kingdonia uniflora]
MDVLCIHYSALYWRDERLRVSLINNPRFGQYCLQGKIRVPNLDQLPNELQELYDGNEPRSRSFQKYIREYNAANAFKSLEVTMDDRVILGRGPSSFAIHGELHLRIGILLPNQGQKVMHVQLYIYNPGIALYTRQRRDPHFRRGNPFCELYRRAYEVLEDAVGEDENFNMPAYLHYSALIDHRRYNLPYPDEIVVILPRFGLKISSVRDIIVYHKAEQGLMRICECRPAYLPFHYVLLFPTGQLGWSIHLKHWNMVRNTWYSSGKSLT